MQVPSGIVHGGFFMSKSEIIKYIHSKDFDRNESIWVLKVIDHKSSQEIAALFNISFEAVELIVQKHEEYWNETK